MYNVALKLRLVDLNYNFECDWLIELSDSKLSNNKLSDNNLASELVENRGVFKPITIEEIVIFMISVFIIPFESNASIKPKENIVHPQERKRYP